MIIDADLEKDLLEAIRLAHWQAQHAGNPSSMRRWKNAEVRVKAVVAAQSAPVDNGLVDIAADLTPEQVEKYIEAADLELGPACVDDWVEQCRRVLRATTNGTGIACI